MENENKGVVLALRLNSEQYERLKKAAKKEGTKVSTFIKKVALITAGDTRELEVLLRAVCAHLESDGDS